MIGIDWLYVGNGLISVLQALAAPIFTGGAVWYARQRWRTENEKMRLDLFDRRWQVFEATVEVIRIAKSRNFEEHGQKFLGFQEASKSARFLFSDEVSRYLDEVWDHVCNLQQSQDEYEDALSPAVRASGATRDVQGLRKAKRVAYEDSKEVFGRLHMVFTPYLSFASIKK